MAHDGHNSYLFRWKKLGNKTAVQKQVEMSSKLAVSEVFSHKKPLIGSPDLAVPLQSSAQLKDHDDAYSEAQALLGDWLHSKLRLELEMDEEDDPIFSAEKHGPIALDICTPTALNYTNFDDFYSCLTKEEESSTINNFLQELMEQEVLDSAMIDQLAMDVRQTRKFRNPAITMEVRHKQVRENRARRDAERQRQQRERETLQEAREEAGRREREAELKRRQQARKQEDKLQMEERRCAQHLARQRYGIYCERRPQMNTLYLKLPIFSSLIALCHKPTASIIKLLLYNSVSLQFVLMHFTAWFSVVLSQRIRMGKAKTVCEWRRKLRVWRAWRAQVLLKQQLREVEKTEEELRVENRCYLLAVQSDKRRLLQRFLNKWQVWTQMEREQRKLLSQQQETRHKMAALISAATSGKLRAIQNPTLHFSTSDTSLVHQEKNPGANMAPVTQPTEPWQISRQHAAPSGAEIRRALQDRGSSCLKKLTAPGARFEHRHTMQQQIISQQRKLLKEQQEQIVQLKEQLVISLELEEQKTAQRLQLASASDTRPRMHKPEPREQRQLRRQHELMSLARQHYHQTLLKQCGLAPWKRLVQLTQANMQVHPPSYCIIVSLFLQLMDWQLIQEERAERFYRVRTFRRVLQALQHLVTQNRLLEWDCQELAEQHNNRSRWFLAWRQLPVLLRREREKEQRREKLVQKVVEILPDFCTHPP
uniref:Uncharacterized protein n=1 Tax=Periophthalmus magnuspinnatus TaxID=409849 RepID=A0A3B4BLY4_9GOBI